MDLAQIGRRPESIFGHGGGNHPYITAPTSNPAWALALIKEASTLHSDNLGSLPTIRSAIYDYLATLAKIDKTYNDALGEAEIAYVDSMTEAELKLLRAILNLAADGSPEKKKG
jgi:hypothetical protein